MSLSALRHLMITPELSCVHLPHRDEREADERGYPAADWDLGGRLPAEIDLVSFDGYNWTNGTTEFEKHREFIEDQVLPGLLPHQRVLLCPYAWTAT